MFNGRFGPWKKFGKMAEKVPQVSAWYNIGHWVINTKNQTRPLLLLTVHNPKTKQIQIQSWPNKPPKPNLYLNKTWVDLSQTHYPVFFFPPFSFPLTPTLSHQTTIPSHCFGHHLTPYYCYHVPSTSTCEQAAFIAQKTATSNKETFLPQKLI